VEKCGEVITTRNNPNSSTYSIRIYPKAKVAL
jgi:hypothetical protein